MLKIHFEGVKEKHSVRTRILNIMEYRTCVVRRAMIVGRSSDKSKSKDPPIFLVNKTMYCFQFFFPSLLTLACSISYSAKIRSEYVNFYLFSQFCPSPKHRELSFEHMQKLPVVTVMD